jgi:conjugal transfer pilus assembly protein TraI
MRVFKRLLAGVGVVRDPPPPSLSTDPAFLAPQSGSAMQCSSVDPGLLAIPVSEIIAANDSLIGKIKLCYGADRATFEKDILRLIRNYAAFVNVLPATADNYFAQQGGLFRLGLEVGFFSLQGTDAHIVSGRSTISARRQLEPRWRHATFIAGLCAELHRTLSQVAVMDHTGNEWPSYLGPLGPWLSAQGTDRFFVRWIAKAQDARTMGLFALQHVVPCDVLQHLSAGNTIVVPHLFASISGMPLYRDNNVLDELVRRASALVIDRDLTASAHRYGKPILGAHLERYLIDAMRRLVASNATWSVNQERSRVWLSTDGLFIVWPNSAADMRKLLETDQLPGIPKSPETIVEILLAAGVLAANADGDTLWSITPPQSKTPLDAIKLASPDILIATLPEAPVVLAQSIVSPRRANVVAPAGAPAAPLPSAAANVRAGGGSGTSNMPKSATVSGVDAKAEQQLALPLDSPPTVPAPTPTTRPAQDEVPAIEAASQRPPQFQLDAPMRLVPAVKEALDEIVSTLNGSGRQAAACTVSAGVFVPLCELARRKVDTGLALRSLADAGMIAGAGTRPRTVEHDFGGKAEIGFILDVRHVLGLNPADFVASA